MSSVVNQLTFRKVKRKVHVSATGTVYYGVDDRLHYVLLLDGVVQNGFFIHRRSGSFQVTALFRHYEFEFCNPQKTYVSTVEVFHTLRAAKQGLVKAFNKYMEYAAL